MTRQPGSSRVPRPARTLIALLIGLLMSASAAEGVLWYFRRPWPVEVGWRTFPKVLRPRLEENQMQSRGQQIEYGDDDYVVVLLGDSQVEATACSFDWMPERRLQLYMSELMDRPVKVFTIGVSGWGQDQQLLALRRYFERYRADHVVEWLTMVNDVNDNTWPTSMPIDGRLKPTFWLEDGELRGPNHRMGEILTSKIRIVAYLQKMFRGSPDRRWAEQHLPPPYQPLQEYDGPVRTDWETWSGYEAPFAEELEMGKSARALMLAPQSELVRYGITLTNRLLKAIRDEAREHGARFTLFGVDKGDRTESMDGVFLLGGNLYRASSAQYWENVRQITEGLVFHLLPVREPRWRVGPVNAHLNEHANDGVMRDLAERIVKGM